VQILTDSISKDFNVIRFIHSAVTRFTKVLDPNKCLQIIQYTTTLIEQLADGRIASRMTDIYPNVHETKVVTIYLP
jgi:phenylalanyl-tRNA synthetase beta subunit